MADPTPDATTLPLGHRFVCGMRLDYCAFYVGGNYEADEAYCGQPESAHRPVEPPTAQSAGAAVEQPSEEDLKRARSLAHLLAMQHHAEFASPGMIFLRKREKTDAEALLLGCEFAAIRREQDRATRLEIAKKVCRWCQERRPLTPAGHLVNRYVDYDGSETGEHKPCRAVELGILPAEEGRDG